VPAYFNKGNVLVNIHKYTEAIDVYKQTFEHERPTADVYCAIGECYEKLELMDEAREHYRKAVKLDPLLADAWFGIGVTLDFDDRYFESLHFYKKALELEDSNPDYWFAIDRKSTRLNSSHVKIS